MTSDLEKKFFDAYGIECNISFHQQFNCAQIPRGLEIYKKREELAKTGRIKIWHKMLNPRPENDCIYWGEYHYPAITDRILLELICLLDFNTRCGNVETLKEKILTHLRGLLSYMRQVHHIPDKENDIYNKVRAVFGLESEEK